MKKTLAQILVTSMFLTPATYAFALDNKANQDVAPISAEAVQEETHTPQATSIEDVKTDVKAQKKAEKEAKKAKKKKKKDDYSEYLIPTEGYMPAGDEKVVKIEGTIYKSLELNLADCLELALLNNPKVKAAYENAASVKTHRGQTLSNYSPRVSIESGYSRVKPNSSTSSRKMDPYNSYLLGTIGISQLIYDFGVTQNQYTIDKLSHQSSVNNIDSVVNGVVYQVKDSYYALMLAIAHREVLKETLEQFEQTYNQAKAFYEVGYRPKIDVTIAEVNLSDAKAKYIESQHNVDVAVAHLNNVMGTPFISPYIVDAKLPFENVDISVKQAVEIANESRPELKMAIASVKIADQYVKLAKKTFFPQLLFNANLSQGGVDSLTQTTWYDFGGYLAFPVINPFLIKNQVDEAKHLYKKQQFDSKSLIHDMYFEIQSTYCKLMEKKERVPVAKLGVKAALENYDIAKGRYKVGLSDPIELKDAQLAYMNSRLAYLQTLYEYNSAKALLEKAIGQTLKDSNPEETEI